MPGEAGECRAVQALLKPASMCAATLSLQHPAGGAARSAEQVRKEAHLKVNAVYPMFGLGLSGTM